MSRAKLRDRVERVAAMLPPPAPPEAAFDRPADEAGELAREAAAAFAEMYRCYHEDFKLSAQEALGRASEDGAPALDHALHCPPDQFSWLDFERIARGDPDAALRRWAEVKEAARGELRAGRRACRSVEAGHSTCWGRAQFLAVRAELVESMRPRDAAELLLIDQMAVAQTQLWEWQTTLSAYALLGSTSRPRRGSAPEPPRVTEAEALEQAAGMVERFQRMFHRALAALEARRRRPAVVVRRAGQVNLANQQVNLSG